MATRICKYTSTTGSGVGVLRHDGDITPLPFADVDEALRWTLANEQPPPVTALAPGEASLLAPIDRHEVWGAGVTYERSRQARVADAAPNAVSAYDDIYDAARPELFFKATPSRVVGPGQPLRPRPDADWTVPEPELALWLGSDLSLLGIGLGNDLTARDVEAANPLYLPQAKIHAACCSVGPAVLACADFETAARCVLTLKIERDGSTLFGAELALSSMRRPLHELVEFLGRHNLFPDGVVLLTGTGIVPPDEVTLLPGDEVVISDPTLGELRNPIEAGAAA